MEHQADSPKIVIGVDWSSGAREALQWGLGEAERRHASVVLLHAFGPRLNPTTLGAGFGFASSRIYHDMAMRARVLLARLSREARVAHPLLHIETVAVGEEPVAALADATSDADLLVVGVRGRGGVSPAAVGPVVTRVATEARCTVVAVPAAGGTDSVGYGVVVGVDGGELHEAAIGWAYGVADRAPTEPLVVVHAWSEPVTTTVMAAVLPLEFDTAQHIEAQRLALAVRLLPWQSSYPRVRVRKVVVQDSPVRALLAASHGARMLVLGSGHRGSRGDWAGSVRHGVLRLASCPVALVHESQQPEPVHEPALPLTVQC
jgi:nucleotide-binding universal stress UspA family protein